MVGSSLPSLSGSLKTAGYCVRWRDPSLRTFFWWGGALLSEGFGLKPSTPGYSYATLSRPPDAGGGLYLSEGIDNWNGLPFPLHGFFLTQGSN